MRLLFKTTYGLLFHWCCLLAVIQMFLLSDGRAVQPPLRELPSSSLSCDTGSRTALSVPSKHLKGKILLFLCSKCNLEGAKGCNTALQLQ